MTTQVTVESSTRRRGLDAAAEALTVDGLEVSMEAIAQRAGVTRMTVYRQLGSRDQVLVAVLVDQGAQVVEALRVILDEVNRPFADRIVDAIVHVVTEVRDAPVLSFFARKVAPSQVGSLDRDGLFLGGVWDLLLPYFEAAAESDVLRWDARSTVDWTLRQILLQLVIEGETTATEAGLRAELHRFFVPSISSR